MRRAAAVLFDLDGTLAGRAAGMQTVVAAYGYLGETDQPELWGPTGIVQRPHQIREWLALRHTDGATTQ